MKDLYYVSEENGMEKSTCLSDTDKNPAKGSNEVSTSKGSYIVIPGRGIGRVLIVKLPPVKKKEIEGMIKFQIQTCYPGSPEDALFDYIVFKGKDEWVILLYFLNRGKLEKLCLPARCRGFLYSIDLVSKRELKDYSRIIIRFTDMVEMWKIEDGIPAQVKLTKPVPPSKEYLTVLETEGPSLVIAGKNERSLYQNLENVTFRTWEFRKRFKYKKDMKGFGKDFLPFVFVWMVILVSTVVLLLTLKELAVSGRNLEQVITYAETVKKNVKKQQEKLKAIKNLEEKLTASRRERHVNFYTLLINICKVLPGNTTFQSITLDNGILSLNCKSPNALTAIIEIKKHFTDATVSKITSVAQDMEQFIIYIGAEQ